MDTRELALHFGLSDGVDPALLEQRLQQAGWPYHRDATGRLWAVAPENSAEDSSVTAKDTEAKT